MNADQKMANLKEVERSKSIAILMNYKNIARFDRGLPIKSKLHFL